MMRDTIAALGRPPRPPERQHDFVRDRYRAYAPHYDRSYRRYSERSRALILDAIADLPMPARVVDVCCGTGFVTAALAERFPPAEVIGVDLSLDMLAQARARFEIDRPRGAPIRFVEATAERLPVEHGSADLVICANAFHLVDRQDAALAEFRRVLRPGGAALIFDWSADSILMRALVAWLHLTQNARRRMHTRGSLALAARRAGLEVDFARSERIPPAWGLMSVRLRSMGKHEERQGTRLGTHLEELLPRIDSRPHSELVPAPDSPRGLVPAPDSPRAVSAWPARTDAT